MQARSAMLLDNKAMAGPLLDFRRRLGCRFEASFTLVFFQGHAGSHCKTSLWSGAFYATPAGSSSCDNMRFSCSTRDHFCYARCASVLVTGFSETLALRCLRDV